MTFVDPATPIELADDEMVCYLGHVHYAQLTTCPMCEEGHGKPKWFDEVRSWRES